MGTKYFWTHAASCRNSIFGRISSLPVMCSLEMPTSSSYLQRIGNFNFPEDNPKQSLFLQKDFTRYSTCTCWYQATRLTNSTLLVPGRDRDAFTVPVEHFLQTQSTKPAKRIPFLHNYFTGGTLLVPGTVKWRECSTGCYHSLFDVCKYEGGRRRSFGNGTEYKQFVLLFVELSSQEV